jgi:hypothetical protein
MPRLPKVFSASLLAALVVVAACGGDDDDGQDSLPTASARTASATSTALGSGGAGTATPGKETPPAGGSEVTPDPGTGGEVPGPSPAPAGQGTPAVRPADADEFLQTIQGMSVDVHPCAYNPVTALANCAGEGVFQIQPPMVGQDITCQLLADGAEALAIQCASVEPPQTMYYEVRG